MPQCHAMSGTWNGKEKNKLGQDKNQQELNAFESDNTDKTKFMVVMNKANEGLHIDGVDGIIWFRALDENSRILYLQQLGRTIFAIDEDNPLLDDKRPIIIDLANNSLTVEMEKEFENVEAIDDLESLTILLEWINNHDGNLPNQNSTNKQEQHYYSILRRIQNKYKKYLEGFDDLEELTEEDKSRIEEIVELASEIDLWSIELQTTSENNEIKKEMNPFEITGILRDFVELNDKVIAIENERAMTRFVRVCEALASQGFDFKHFKYVKTVEENGQKIQRDKTLKDVVEEYPNIDIEKVLKEAGVRLDYSIGNAKGQAVLTVQGKGNRILPITEEEKQKLVQLGVVKLNKERSITRFVRVCEALSRQGFEFEEFNYSRKFKENGKKKQVGKTLEDVTKEYPNIDIEKVIKEAQVDLDYPFGATKELAVSTIQGKANAVITEEEKQKLIQLGVIKLEKESAVAIFLRVCESLAKQNFDFNTFSYSKMIGEGNNKKQKNKTLEDIKLEYPNIDIEKVLEETGVELNYSIGSAKHCAVKAVEKTGLTKIAEEEKLRLIELGVIKLEKERSITTFLKVCEALVEQNFNFDKFGYSKRIKVNGKIKKEYRKLKDIQEEFTYIDIEKIIEKTGVTLDYSIGAINHRIIKAINANKRNLVTKEEEKRLIELGVVKEKSLKYVKQERDDAKEKNDKAKELEEQISEELRERGNIHEETIN